MRSPVVLFVSRSSNYRRLGVECYGEDRDAMTFRGDAPVVAHPPCRGWGRLAHWSKHTSRELELALFAVDVVRSNGGVLEHPAFSRLFDDAKLPDPGCSDGFGGWTLPVSQSWWGHRAPKSTWLYIVGVSYRDLPSIPFHLGVASGRVHLMGKPERERTPLGLCRWLLEVASRSRSIGVAA